MKGCEHDGTIMEDECACQPHHCDTTDRILHPERYENQVPWIPTPQEVAIALIDTMPAGGAILYADDWERDPGIASALQRARERHVKVQRMMDLSQVHGTLDREWVSNAGPVEVQPATEHTKSSDIVTREAQAARTRQPDDVSTEGRKPTLDEAIDRANEARWQRESDNHHSHSIMYRCFPPQPEKYIVCGKTGSALYEEPCVLTTQP